METITFYSYKGGVGRTLALANVGVYLSRFGQNVCILDFDLEAPGLHYKFPKLLQTADIRSGLVDYTFEFTHNGIIPESLESFSLVVIQHSKSQGGIRLIPAGNILSPDYWNKLASIDWNGLFYESHGEGVPFFLELKERIRKEFRPDFLLIDSRTGITEMSGICTYLFPEKIVFLIINNEENIEGARQILRSIQRLQRLPKQKPIKVVFALTRIPFPKEEKEEKEERQIINHIKELLNKPTEELESQLNVEDICILHSDRNLELSESLRISQLGITEETPLSRDYLRLFSKIVPEKVVEAKIESVLDKITKDIWVDADKSQEELEQLAASYPHSKSLEKLLDFYFIRKEDKEKKLKTFHKLWEISGIFSSGMLSKYVSMFLETDYFYSYGEGKFNLEIIERYLDSNPDNRIEVELKLAEAYAEYENPEAAFKHYFRLLKEAEDKKPILSSLLDLYIETESYSDATELLKSYIDDIESEPHLRLKVIEILFRTDRIAELQRMLDRDSERNLAEEKPILYIELLETLGRSDEVSRKLGSMLSVILRDRRKNFRAKRSALLKLGRAFYRLGRENEFDDKLRKRYPRAEEIINTIRRRY